MEDVSLFVLFLISNSLFCKDDHRNTIEWNTLEIDWGRWTDRWTR
jgi:hypothetical protein